MQRRKSIIKLSVIGAVLLIWTIFTFVPINGVTRYKSVAGAIKLGIDLKGGMYAVYQANEGSGSTEATYDEQVNAAVTRVSDILRTRGGYTEATVVKQGSNRIRVEVPDVSDPEEIFRIIGEPVDLEFVDDGTGEVFMTGKNVRNAYQSTDESQNPCVVLVFDSAGRDIFAAKSSALVGGEGTITIRDAISGNTISKATVKSAITNGRANITGSFTIAQADQLASQILSGAMSVKLELKESGLISPTLGASAMVTTLIAGGLGLLLIMLFLYWRYGIFGLLASAALMCYAVVLLFLLAVLPFVQLTLPGLAGIILGLGMAVDANIIIFERIRDEYKQGKSMQASIASGFKKAFWAIFDSNITTLIAAVVLWVLGVGSIIGFAVTLFISILLSFGSAIYLTRYFIKHTLIALGNKATPERFKLRRPDSAKEIPDEKPEDQSGNKDTAAEGLV